MIHAPWKLVALIAAAVGSGAYVESKVLCSHDEYMKGLRSELVEPTGRGVIDVVEPTVPRVLTATDERHDASNPETRPSRSSMSDLRHAPETRSFAESVPPRVTPRTTSPFDQNYFVHPMFTGARLSTDNLATNPVTASHGIAITYERFGYEVCITDPVIPMSGEFVFNQPIVTVPGKVMPLAFGLHYRSGYQYNGPVGMNWEHNWNARIEEPTAGGDIDLYSNGRVDHYTESGTADVFTMPVGSFEKSVKRYPSPSRTPAAIERLLQDGTLEVYENLNNTAEPGWYFLTSVKHRDQDNAISLAYDGAAKLTSITDTRGKAFTLSYDSNRRVTTFSDWSSGGGSADRFWTLAYDSNDDLTRVSAPAVGGVTRNTDFTYDANDLLLSVKAPREVAASGAAYLQMQYDASKRVTQQVFGSVAATQKYTIVYGSNKTTEIDREGASRIYEYNANLAITKIRQERTSGTFEDSYCYWDASNGLLTKTVAPEGNGMLYQYSDGMLTASIKSNASGLSATSIATMRSGTDHLVTEYVYQSTADWKLVTKVIDPRAAEWTMARDSLGNVTTYKTPEGGSTGFTITYDSNSRPLTVTDPESKVVAFAYGTSGQVSTVTANPSGLSLQTTFARDQFGNVTSVTDPSSATASIARNVLGYPTSVTTSLGYVTDYFYDLNDRVTEVRRDHGNADITNAEQRTLTSYTILDEVSAVTMQYGSSYGSNRILTYARDKEDRITSVTLPKGNSTTTTYDMRGLAVTKTVAAGTGYASSSTTEYDQNHRVTKAKDGLTHETTLAYDGFDRVTRVTDPASHYSVTAYDKNSNAITRQAFNSGNTKLTESVISYDLNNRVTTRTELAKESDLSTNIGSGTIQSTMSYDKGDRLTQATDSCGCGGGSTATTYAFDAAGRKTKVTDALGNSTTSHLDTSGRVTKTTADEIEGGTTKSYVVEFAYDSDGHLTSSSQRGGGSDTALTTTYVVDAFGRMRTSTDPNGNVVANLYDDFGRVTKLRRRLTGGGSPTYLDTVMVYDLNDNVVTRTNVRGSGDTSSRYEFDQADRMTAFYDEAGSDTESYTYNAAHSVATRTDRNGSVVTYTYDSRNLVLTKSYSLATNVLGPTIVKYGYDGLGRVTMAYNVDARVERKWNTLSKLEAEKTWITPTSEDGSGSTPREVIYKFSDQGLLSTVKYPDGSFGVKRTYDSLNRVSKIERTDDITAGSPTFVATADWDFSGPSRMTKLTLGSDRCRESLTYDVYGRATQLTWDRLKDGTRYTTVDFKRGYDAGSRVTYERRDYIAASTNTTLGGVLDYGDRYYYDGANRLTKTLYGVGYGTSSHSAVESASESTTDFIYRRQFTLDEVGNRKTLQYDTPAQSGVRREDHVYDTQNQLGTRTVYDWNGSTLTQTSTEANTFDTNGNQKTSPTLKVDIENRIYEATAANAHVWHYKYDPFGRRIVRRDTTNTDTWGTHTYYDGAQPIEEFRVDKNSSPLTDTRMKFVRVYGPYLVDQIVWSRFDVALTGSAVTFEGDFQGDYLGSVQCIVRDGGVLGIEGGVLETYRYSEYGQVQFCDGDGNPYSPNASQGEQDFTYTGREWNQELGLYYYRARWYRPETGGFLERDPIRDGAGVHGFAYVEASPLDSIDPDGDQLRLAKKTDSTNARESACQPECSKFECPIGTDPTPDFDQCCERRRQRCLNSVGDAIKAYNKTASDNDKMLDEGVEVNDPGGGLGNTLTGGALVVVGGIAMGVALATPPFGWAALGLAAVGGGTAAGGAITVNGSIHNADGKTHKTAGLADRAKMEGEVMQAGYVFDAAVADAKNTYNREVDADCCKPVRPKWINTGEPFALPAGVERDEERARVRPVVGGTTGPFKKPK